MPPRPLLIILAVTIYPSVAFCSKERYEELDTETPSVVAVTVVTSNTLEASELRSSAIRHWRVRSQGVPAPRSLPL